MPEIKWIKLDVCIFDDEKIKLLKGMPDRDALILIWIQLLVMAGKSNMAGFVSSTENETYSEEDLSILLDRPVNTVRLALQLFTSAKFKMLENTNHGLRIVNWEKHQNIEGMERLREEWRKASLKYRETKKQLMLSNTNSSEISGTKEYELLKNDNEIRTNSSSIGHNVAINSDDLSSKTNNYQAQQRYIKSYDSHTTDKIREDKRRVEKSREESQLLLGEIFKLYEDVFGKLNDFLSNEIKDACTEHGEQLVLDSMKKAAFAGSGKTAIRQTVRKE